MVMSPFQAYLIMYRVWLGIFFTQQHKNSIKSSLRLVKTILIVGLLSLSACSEPNAPWDYFEYTWGKK